MAGLVPAIHAFLSCKKDVDARHKAGHDGGWGGVRRDSNHLLSGGFGPSTGGSDLT
jgi:hypothetical protein